MKIIRLKDEYPWCSGDEYIEVSDEVAAFFEQSRKDEESRRVKAIQHRSFYSLDIGQNVENEVTFFSSSTEELYIRKLTQEELYQAISELSDKQAKRIWAHFFQNISYADIARIEGVKESSVRESILNGLTNIEKKIKNF